MSHSYESHVNDGVYSGDDAVLQKCFLQAQRLRRSAQFMNALLAAGKQVKGMLNEDKYEDRLAENRDRPDALREIVRHQETRRCEYFRARMLLQYHILPVVSDALQCCIELTRTVNARRKKESWQTTPESLGLDEYSAVGQILSATSEQDVFAQYARAVEFVSEPDATNGKGEKSLEREAILIDGFVHWRDTIIPVEFQLVESPHQHELDRALLTEISRIEPILHSSREEVKYMEGFEQYRYGAQKLRATGQALKWPEVLRRVSSYVRVGNPIDGYSLGWCDRNAKTFKKLLAVLRAAIATMSGPERWLAQSNCIGAAYRIVKHLQSLETGAYNTTIGASEVGHSLRRQTDDLIANFLKEAEGLKV